MSLFDEIRVAPLESIERQKVSIERQKVDGEHMNAIRDLARKYELAGFFLLSYLLSWLVGISLALEAQGEGKCTYSIFTPLRLRLRPHNSSCSYDRIGEWHGGIEGIVRKSVQMARETDLVDHGSLTIMALRIDRGWSADDRW
jgi:hypothetical protein